MNSPTDDATLTEQLRARLFGIAYRMLGHAHDAEDVVQEALLRWHGADRVAVNSADAWLVAVTSRLAIDRLRRVTTERALYEGPWLPEPIATFDQRPTDRDAELASDLSMAFLVLLERLAPEERAAFLLRDVFDTEYGEIARILSKEAGAVRQMVHRARERVRKGRTRFEASADASAGLLRRFLAALEADDADELLAVFDANATFTSDGGGKVSAMRNVVSGAEAVTTALLGYERKGRGLTTHRIASVNGDSAILTFVGERLAFATFVDGDGARLTAVYRLLNPDKLGRLGEALFEWP
ncbi:MAG: sigma-70 family RNA polymerase sigma factor [bacterium]